MARCYNSFITDAYSCIDLQKLIIGQFEVHITVCITVANIIYNSYEKKINVHVKKIATLKMNVCVL